MNNYHLGSNKSVLITLQILNVPFTFPQFTGIAVIFFHYFIARNQSVNGNLISDLVCSHSVTSIIVMPRPVHNLVNSVGQYFDGMQEMTRVIYIEGAMRKERIRQLFKNLAIICYDEMVCCIYSNKYLMDI